MDIIVKETNERHCLYARDPATGADYTLDLLNAKTSLPYDEMRGAYLMGKSEYEWWSTYICQQQADERAIYHLRKKYGNDVVNQSLTIAFDGIEDFNDHHRAYLETIAMIQDPFEAAS